MSPHAPSQYGTLCLLTMDLHDTDDPQPGDMFRSEAGAYYLIREAREIDSSVSPNRWSLSCVRMDPDDVNEDEVSFTFYWYPRERRRR